MADKQKKSQVPNLGQLVANDEGMQELAANLKDLLRGFALGNTTDLAGFPVDAIGSALRTAGIPVPEKAVGGSDWLRAMLDQKPASEDSAAALLGSLIGVPDPQSLAALGGIMIGPKAAGFNKEGQALFEAWAKDNKAADPEFKKALFEQYRQFQSPGDGKLRQEISDEAARLKIEQGAEGQYLLADVLDHPELFKAYPEMANLRVSATPSGQFDLNAFYDPGNLFRDEVIGFNPNAVGAEGILLHEVQHAIQNKEGFARGGATENFKAGVKAFDEAKAAAKGRIPDTRLADILYKRLAGEAEARLTQGRRMLTSEERLGALPYLFDPQGFGYDVPLEKLILRSKTGKVLDQPSAAAKEKQQELNSAHEWLSQFLSK